MGDLHGGAVFLRKTVFAELGLVFFKMKIKMGGLCGEVFLWFVLVGGIFLLRGVGCKSIMVTRYFGRDGG